MPRTRADVDANRRKRTLAAIHAAAHKLGLADDVYRDLVERVSRAHGPAQRSAGKCDLLANKITRRDAKRDVSASAVRPSQPAVWRYRPRRPTCRV